MDLQQQGRQLALSFVNIDDLVLARELSASGIHLLSFAGRSLVGSAVVGAGVATRAAMFGAQVATKSALAVANAAAGRVPGGEAARQVARELDRSVGRSGEGASFVASQGVVVAKPDRRPPAEPIFGEPWLAKRLPPGATSGTVLVDSAFELARLVVSPLVTGTTLLTGALSSSAGEQATRSFWDALSSIVDSVSRPAKAGPSAADRSDRRALLLLLGLAPLVAAAQDSVEFSEALARASAGDSHKLKVALTTALDRIASEGDAGAARHTPARLLAALDERQGGEVSRLTAIGRAMIEDGGTLSKVALAYVSVLGGLLTTSLQSAVNGALDVDAIEAWVRDDEASRARSGDGRPERCPASVRQLETLVAAFSRAEADPRRRGFAVPGTIELARDEIFAYSTRALGRDAALARMERLFGAAARQRLEDDCSLRPDIIDAGRDRDRRLAALVLRLQGEGSSRLARARHHAARRLQSLTANTADHVFERLVPQRLGARVAALHRFVGMADMAGALDADRAEREARRKVAAAFNDWILGDVEVVNGKW